MQVELSAQKKPAKKASPAKAAAKKPSAKKAAAKAPAKKVAAKPAKKTVKAPVKASAKVPAKKVDAKKPAAAKAATKTKQAAPAKKGGKVYFTTVGPDGSVHTRGSRHDYGYTHAAWYKAIGKWYVAFSTTKEGALKNAGAKKDVHVSKVTKSNTKPGAKKATPDKAVKKTGAAKPEVKKAAAPAAEQPKPAAATKQVKVEEAKPVEQPKPAAATKQVPPATLDAKKRVSEVFDSDTLGMSAGSVIKNNKSALKARLASSAAFSSESDVTDYLARVSRSSDTLRGFLYSIIANRGADYADERDEALLSALEEVSGKAGATASLKRAVADDSIIRKSAADQLEAIHQVWSSEGLDVAKKAVNAFLSNPQINDLVKLAATVSAAKTRDIDPSGAVTKKGRADIFDAVMKAEGNGPLVHNTLMNKGGLLKRTDLNGESEPEKKPAKKTRKVSAKKATAKKETTKPEKKPAARKAPAKRVVKKKAHDPATKVLNEFAASMDSKVGGRARKTLSGSVKWFGKDVVRHRLIENLIDDGATIGTHKGKKALRAPGADNAVIWAVEKDLTQTGLKYAEWLIKESRK